MTKITEDRLREQLQEIAGWTGEISVPDVPTAEVTMLPLGPVHQQRARQVWAIIGIAAAMVVALVAVSTARRTPAPVADGRWLPMAEAPIPPRSMPATAWTGEEVIVAGGEAADGTWLRDAAAYNPATNTWRRLPDAPAPIGPGSQTALTQEALLVAVPSAVTISRHPKPRPLDPGKALLFDRDDGTWAAVDVPTELLAIGAASGEVVGMRRLPATADGDRLLQFERLDLRTLTWTPFFGQLQHPSGAVNAWLSVPDGDAVHFVPRRWLPQPVNHVTGFTLDSLAEPGQFAMVVPPPGRRNAHPARVVTRAVPDPLGSGVVVLVLAFDNTGGVTTAMQRSYHANSWLVERAPSRDALPVEEEMFEAFGASATSDRILLTGGLRGAGTVGDGFESAGALATSIEAATDRWIDLPKPPIDMNRVGHVSVWTGRELVVWGGLRRSPGAPINRADTPATGGARFIPSD